MICRDNNDPVKMACTSDPLQVSEYNRKVVGQPKYHWWIKGLEAYWEHITENYKTPYRGVEFEWKAKHLQFIEYAAWAGWGLDKSELTEEQFYATIQGNDLEDGKREQEKINQDYYEYYLLV